jgi:parallel beta-helix repeat protein
MTRRNAKRSASLCGRIGACAVAAIAIAIAAPSMASAMGTVWVSPSPVSSPPGSGCSSPGFNAIQAAITASSAKKTIHVCAGTYTEQVSIEKQDAVVGEPGATLKLPASPANSTSACDVAGEQDLVTICGAGKVKISGLTLEGTWPTNSCSGDQVDVLVAGGSSLGFEGSKIVHAGPEPANFGCGGGLGLEIGHKRNGQVGSAKIKAVSIEGYEKNGITVDGPGSKAKISDVVIKGQPLVNVAQNGIQVSRGATAKISAATIEGNECGASSCGPNTKGFAGPEEWEEAEDAAGVLFYEAGGKSFVKSSSLNGNDVAIYNMLDEPSAKTTITNNTLNGNRFWSIALDEGGAKINNNTISGPGKAGIQVVQYAKNEEFHAPGRGQAFSATGSGSGDTISGMECALEGFSDNEPADHPASLSLKNSASKFSGNTQQICNNNTNGKLSISVG